MAQVPISHPDVAPIAAPTDYQTDAGVTPAAFGALQANGLIQGGEKLSQAGDELQRRALTAQQFNNEREAKQADVTLADKIRTITYGDGTADNPGYYSMRGDSAVQGGPAALAAIAKARDDVLSSVSNDRVKAMVSGMAGHRVVAEQTSIGSFLTQQRREADNGASSARMDSAINDAALRWNQPEQLAMSQGIIKNEVADYAVRNGFEGGATGAQARQLSDQQNTKLLTNVIKAAGRVDFASAEKILTTAADQGTIPGDALAGIERELRTDQHMQMMLQEHQQVMADRAATKAAVGAYNGYISAAIDPQNPDPIDLHAVANDPILAAHPNLKMELYNFQKQQDKGQTPAKVSAATTNMLYPFIHLPDGDPNKITDERQLDQYVTSGQLNPEGLKFLRGEIQDDRDPAGNRLGQEKAALVKAASAQIQGTNALGLPDPNKSMNAYLYQRMVTDTLNSAKQNNENPRDYLTPGNPKYLGSPAVLARYQRSFEDIMKDTTDAMSRPSGDAVNPAGLPPGVNPNAAALNGPPPMPAGAPPVLKPAAVPQASDYQDTPESSGFDKLKADVKSGKISRGDGVRIGQQAGWITRQTGPKVGVSVK